MQLLVCLPGKSRISDLVVSDFPKDISVGKNIQMQSLKMLLISLQVQLENIWFIMMFYCAWLTLDLVI